MKDKFRQGQVAALLGKVNISETSVEFRYFKAVENSRRQAARRRTCPASAQSVSSSAMASKSRTVPGQQYDRGNFYRRGGQNAGEGRSRGLPHPHSHTDRRRRR